MHNIYKKQNVIVVMFFWNFPYCVFLNIISVSYNKIRTTGSSFLFGMLEKIDKFCLSLVSHLWETCSGKKVLESRLNR